MTIILKNWPRQPGSSDSFFERVKEVSELARRVSELARRVSELARRVSE